MHSPALLNIILNCWYSSWRGGKRWTRARLVLGTTSLNWLYLHIFICTYIYIWLTVDTASESNSWRSQSSPPSTRFYFISLFTRNMLSVCAFTQAVACVALGTVLFDDKTNCRFLNSFSFHNILSCVIWLTGGAVADAETAYESGCSLAALSFSPKKRARRHIYMRRKPSR